VASALDIGHVFVVHPSLGTNGFTGFAGLTAEPLTLTDMFDDYALDVACFLEDNSDHVRVEVDFDDRVIAASHVERMLESLEAVAAQQLDSQQRPECSGMLVDDIQPISKTDVERIWACNAQVPTEPSRNLVHKAILEMAASDPAAEAVCA
jgi:hypothetical protein